MTAKQTINERKIVRAPRVKENNKRHWYLYGRKCLETM